MKNKGFYGLKYLLAAFLLLVVVYPTVYLFSTIRGEHLRQIFQSPQFMPMLTNSLVTTLLATGISVALSFALAYALNRSNVWYKPVFVVLFTIPMLIQIGRAHV